MSAWLTASPRETKGAVIAHLAPGAQHGAESARARGSRQR